ncbi:MAG: sigma-70 family RNA polymerase sigma factor [Pirellulales bacterium]
MAAPDEASNWAYLLESARAGDAEKLGLLLLQVSSYLRLCAAERLEPRLRCKLSESDLVQQSLVEAAAGFQRFRGHTEEEFRRWSARILYHNLADAKRRFLGAVRDVRREESGSQLTSAVAPHKGPSSLARRGELDLQLIQALRRLPQSYRHVIELRHAEDLSWEEIGFRCDVSAEAARKLWTRAIKQLQAILVGDESRLDKQ